MGQKNYNLWTGVVFLVIAVLHLFRIVRGWEAQIGGWMMPMWLSWIALVVAALLVYSAYTLYKKHK